MDEGKSQAVDALLPERSVTWQKNQHLCSDKLLCLCTVLKKW